MNTKILAALIATLLLSSPVFAGSLEALSASYDPAPVAPGSQVTVWVQIKNDSYYKAENTLVKIETEFPFSLQPGEAAEKNLGTVKGYETITAEYKLLVDAKAVDGAHSIDVLVGEEFLSKESSFTINVLSRTPKLEIVETSTNELTPGAVETVELSIKNIGGSIAKDIVLKVNPERTVTSTGVVVEREIVSLGASANYIDSLEKDEMAKVQLALAVNQDATLKNYSIPVTLEYFDQNGSAKTETGYLGIKVTADAEVDAVINSISPGAYPGGTSEIVVDMFNIGLADAKYVVIELEGEHITAEEPRQFVGTLEADDFDSFKTKVRISPTAPAGPVPMTLKIIYKDDQLQEQVSTKNLYLEAGAAGQGGGFDIFGAILGLIGLALQLVGLYVIAKKGYPKAKAILEKRKK